MSTSYSLSHSCLFMFRRFETNECACHSLSREALAMLVITSFIASKVDYCNVAFAGLARANLIGFSLCWMLVSLLVHASSITSHRCSPIYTICEHPVQVMHSCAPLPQWCSTTVSDRAGSATVGRGLASSAAFSVHGWSSGASHTCRATTGDRAFTGLEPGTVCLQICDSPGPFLF